MKKYVTADKQCAHLPEFLDIMLFYFPFIADDPIAIRDLTLHFVKQQATNKIYYTEARFEPHEMSGELLSPEDVLRIHIAALTEGV